jgi:ABC-2 type transport system ATP-binding protein
MTPVIETRGLAKTYGAVRAVVDLDLEVETGEVFAFLGPNGAGKSTTIRMLLALQRPTFGTASLFGLDSHADRVEIHRRVGYLPGDLELFPRMTGRHVIDWFSHARGGVDRETVDHLVERFQAVTERPVKELSKGNRQKLGIVLAFMTRPELLVLDEPTVGLDPLMRNEFETLIRETVAEGKTVFLSSHELDEVQRLADRAAIIKEGRLIVTDTVDGLRRSLPRKIEVEFRQPVDRSVFDGLAGVRIVSTVIAPDRGAQDNAASDGAVMAFEVTGEIAPFLHVVVDHDPIDFVSRRPDLDELFLDFYRSSEERPVDAR